MYELIDPKWTELCEVLVKHGVFRKTEYGPGYMISTEVMPIAEIKNQYPDIKIPLTVNTQNETQFTSESMVKSGVDQYLTNGYSIESNFETISREYLGFVEEKRNWTKDLKNAVKEYGHDEVLSGFYTWVETNSNFSGRKPISYFLKFVGSNLGATRKTYSNQNLDRILEDIARLTDSTVLFYGTYRTLLAGLVKDHGHDVVYEAFERFYEPLDDYGIKFASKNFIEQSGVLVATVVRKRREAQQESSKIAAAYQQAQSNVYQEPEEDLEDL